MKNITVAMRHTTKLIYAPSAASLLHTALPSPLVQVVLNSYDSHNFDGSSDALADWLNARIKKAAIR